MNGLPYLIEEMILHLLCFFKIIHNLVDLDPGGIVLLCPSDYDTRGHHDFFKYQQELMPSNIPFFHSQQTIELSSRLYS